LLLWLSEYDGMQKANDKSRTLSFPAPPGEQKRGFEGTLEDVRGSLAKATLYLGRLEKLVEGLAEEHEVEVSRAKSSAGVRVQSHKGDKDGPIAERSGSLGDLESRTESRDTDNRSSRSDRSPKSAVKQTRSGDEALRKEVTGDSQSLQVSWASDSPIQSGQMQQIAAPVPAAPASLGPVSATNPSNNYQPLAPAAEPSEPDEPDDSACLAELPRCISGDTVVGYEEFARKSLEHGTASMESAIIVVEPCQIWTNYTKRPSTRPNKGTSLRGRDTQQGGGDFQVAAKRQSMKMTRGLSRSKSNLFTVKNADLSIRRKLTNAFTSGDRTDCLKTMSETLVASPTSTRRLLWDVAGMTLIAYDLVLFPLQSFDPPRLLIFDIMGLITSIFWTFDIPMSFFVGYHDGGVIKMNMGDIARKYARSWLFFDLTVVTVDWVGTFMEISSNEEEENETTTNVGAVRIAKAARFLRMLRLLRLLKVSGMFEHILEHIQSEFTRIILGICQLIAFIICANHVIACGFYAISVSDRGRHRWVYHFDVKERSLAYRYFTSLHWSLTQFTPASMEIVPRNAAERVYNVVTLLFAMITFSSFVSSLTNAMTQLRNLNSDKLAQYTMLRRYLRDHEVTVNLTTRIWHWLSKDTKGNKHRIHEKDVVILSMLPSTLTAELRNQVVGPFVVPHPFFFQFGGSNPMLMRRVYKSLTEHSALTGKELFAAGDIGDSMYFVVSGTCKYYASFSGMNVDGSRSLIHNGRISVDSGMGAGGDQMLTKGNWMCEPVLWVKWKHVGQVVAKEHTELFALVASRFHHIIEQNVGEAWSVVRYAKLFAERLRSLHHAINDVWADFDVLQEMAQEAFQDECVDHTDVSISLSRTIESSGGRTFDSVNKGDNGVGPIGGSRSGSL